MNAISVEAAATFAPDPTLGRKVEKVLIPSNGVSLPADLRAQHHAEATAKPR